MESVATVVASIAIPIGYVGFIHMFDYNGVNRNHLESLKKRFYGAFVHNAVSLGVSYALLRNLVDSPFLAMGFHLHGTLAAVACSSFLTGIFYLGNCLEMVHDELHFPHGIGLLSLKSWMTSARELTFIRSSFVAPVTEEIAFRACSATLFYNCFGWNGSVFIAPVFFSLSHLHLVFDDMRKGLTKEAIPLRTFQACYSYLFGVYATFLLMKTNHILAPIISHSICNSFGLPNYCFIGSSRKWTCCIFAAHIIGAVGWESNMTSTSNTMATKFFGTCWTESHAWRRVNLNPNKAGPSRITIVDNQFQAEKPCSSKDVRSSVPTLSYGLELKYWEGKDAKPAELPKERFDAMNFWKSVQTDVEGRAMMPTGGELRR